MRQKLLRRAEIQPAGEILQFGFVLGQLVRLLIVHQLQRVLDRPQKHVAVGEQAVFVGVQKSALGQPHQGVERVEAADGRLFAAVDQLQVLHDELNVADRTFPQLDFAPRLAAF